MNDLKMTTDDFSNLSISVLSQNESLDNKMGTIIPDDDEIVISGISGRYPLSDNLEEFKNNLYSGTDMVNDMYNRWPKGIYGVPERMGTIKDISKFDATFFNVHPKQAEVMDPQGRLILEVAYEAIVDAGMSPIEVRGSRTSVINGCVFSESELYLSTYAEDMNPYGLTGCVQATFPNRVSFAFDFKGTSYSINTMCSSGLVALTQAVNAMRSGQCDAAIVSGTNLCIRPETSLCLAKHGMISTDGACRAFDEDCLGYARSEGAVALFLQRKSVARRYYAAVVHAKTSNDGYKVEGFPTVNSNSQKKLITDALREAGVKPSQVEYFEAHGTGTKVGDPNEVNAIADSMCLGRNGPLLIGSVKSNCGHTEPASALVSISKLVLTMETGIIAGNLHYKNPNLEIPALRDGRLKVVTENTQYKGGLIAVNAFGVGGSNSHGIFKRNDKEKKLSKYDYNIARLIAVSGRTREAINTIFNSLDPENIDVEFLALIDNIHKYNIPGHVYRGYGILKKTLVKEITETPKKPPQVWYIFSGTGAQWPGLAKDLMDFPVFSKSIRECALALVEYNCDLMDIFTNTSEDVFDKVTNTFVAIVATQIALVDLLTSLGIQPDGMIGHSLGELGCAYADGTLTAIQTIKAAYWRGQCLLDCNLAKGSMASIGLSWEEALHTIPSDIQLACQNSSDNTTVSGPPEDIQQLVDKLQKDKIFAQIINSSGIAFHSRYISAVSARFISIFQEIIPEPKSRSSKWISTSIPESKWSSHNAKYASADYFLNNLLSPVLFHSAVALIPEGAVVVEVAPHRLFRTILKRSLGKKSTYIGLLDKYHNDNAHLLLDNIGKLYNFGLQPQIARLYPEVEFPVSRGTPSFSPLVKWDHSYSWPVASASNIQIAGQDAIIVNLMKKEYKFLSDHVIDGRILFPAAGYLSLAWKILAKKLGKNIKEMPIVFEDVKFHRATILANDDIKFSINILTSTGAFEIFENGDIVSSGTIRFPQNIDTEYVQNTSNIHEEDEGDKELLVNCDDIYKYLRNAGYEYGENFHGVVSSNVGGTSGKLKWNNNWISFVESMIQLFLFGDMTESLRITTNIQKIVINPQSHSLFINNRTSKREISVQRDKILNVIRCGGVEVKGLETSLVSSRRQKKSRASMLIVNSFVPYDNEILGNTPKGKNNALFQLLQNALENTFTSDIKIAEIIDNASILSLSNIDILISIFECKINTTEYEVDLNQKLIMKNKKDHVQPYHLVIGSNIITKDNVMDEIISILSPKGMLILEEKVDSVKYEKLNRLNLIIASTQKVNDKIYILLKLKMEDINDPLYFNVNDKSYLDLKEELAKNTIKRKVYILSGKENESKAISMINRLKNDANGDMVRLISYHDSEGFDMKSNQSYIDKDLLINVYKNCTWGSYKYLIFDREHKEITMVKDAYVGTIKEQNKVNPLWISIDTTSVTSHPESDVCQVYSSCVNEADMLKASDKYQMGQLITRKNARLGIEFAGIVNSISRVMGLVPNGALATRVKSDNLLTWEVPKEWTFNEAATIPLAYVTAYYTLVSRGSLQNGEKVMVRNGANPSGIAAMTVALSKNCVVFTTVSNKAEKSLLSERFPQLAEGAIVEASRVEQFLLTSAKQIDLLLEVGENSNSQYYYNNLAPGGRVLHISFENEKKTATLPMDAQYHTINLDSIFNMNQKQKRELSSFIKDAIVQRVIKPLPYIQFSSSDIQSAFRNLKVNTFNKVVVEVNKENEEPQKISAIVETQFKADFSYIILGELNGFVMAVASWLISAGSKCIIFTFEGIKLSQYESLQIKRWQRDGVAIHSLNMVKSKNVKYEDCKLLVDEAKKIAPIAGIFNLSHNRTELNYQSDIILLENLHSASKNADLRLDHFVHFTTFVTKPTNKAGINKNCPIKYLMESRKNRGLPGLMIQCCTTKDIANGDTPKDDLLLQQYISSCIQTIDAVLNQRHHMVISIQESGDTTEINGISNGLDVVQAVANIIGITEVSKAPTNSTLVDLGMDSLMEPEIRSLLATKYSIKFDISEIRELTFDTLQELSSHPRLK